jgi:hypothetical protein
LGLLGAETSAIKQTKPLSFPALFSKKLYTLFCKTLPLLLLKKKRTEKIKNDNV